MPFLKRCILYMTLSSWYTISLTCIKILPCFGGICYLSFRVDNCWALQITGYDAVHTIQQNDNKCEFKCTFLSQKWHYDSAHSKPIKQSFSAATRKYTHLSVKYDKYSNKNLFLSFLYYILFNFTQKILQVRLCQIWYFFM